MSATRLPICLAGALLVALVLSACGSSSGGGGGGASVPPPSDPTAPVSGTLRAFAYQDTVTDEMLDPFRKANPDLNVETASFGSDQAAAAKLAGGFKADVVEVCLDEMKPLLKRGLLQPVDPKGVTDWNKLAFTGSDRLKAKGGGVWFVPLSAGPQGVIYNTAAIKPPPTSFADLFDPKYAGRVALEGDYALPPIAETALVLGYDDPMNLTQDQLDAVGTKLDQSRDQFRSLWKTDADLVQLYKSGEVDISDGGPGLAQRIRDTGVPVKWVNPSEGALSWVCGLGIPTGSQNTDAAYALINWQASAKAQALRANDGYTVTNPEALKLADPASRKTADPSLLKGAIPESEPPDYDQWTRKWEEFQAG